MWKMGDAFVPHRVVDSRVRWSLVGAQVALALGFWAWEGGGVLPGPRAVGAAFARLWTEEALGREVLVSLGASVEAVLLSALLALPLAWLSVLPVMQPLVTLLTKGRFLGLMGLTLVFTLLTGGGHALKLALLVTGMSVFLVTGMEAVVASVPRERLDHARTLRFSPWRTVFEVVVLGTADTALELVRQNAAIGWTMVTMVEGLTRSEGGVGALLLNQNKHFHLAEVFAVQLCILGVGLGQDALLRAARRALCPYAELRSEAR